MSATSSPQRRPRQRLDADERRAQIIAATVRILAGRGYLQTSVNAIAAEAGISKGLVWHYFTDRDDLMEQTAQQTLIRLRDVVATDIDLAAEAPETIRSAIRRAAALLATHRAELEALRQITRNLRLPDGSPRLGVADYEETYGHQEEEIFRRGQAQGTLRTDIDTRVMAVTYQGAVDAMLAYLESHPDVEHSVYAAAVADLLLTGLAAAPQEGHR